MLAREGIRVIRLPPRSPNLTAYAERWTRGVRDECLSKVIPIGQGMLHRALREYVAHHHLERNHQGLGNAVTPCAIVEGQDRTIGRLSEANSHSRRSRCVKQTATMLVLRNYSIWRGLTAEHDLSPAVA
jgi:hypothetical protein